MSLHLSTLDIAPPGDSDESGDDSDDKSSGSQALVQLDLGVADALAEESWPAGHFGELGHGARQLVFAASQALVAADAFASDGSDLEDHHDCTAGIQPRDILVKASTDKKLVKKVRARLKECQQLLRRLTTKNVAFEENNSDLLARVRLLGGDRETGQHLLPRRAFDICLKSGARRASLHQLSLLAVDCGNSAVAPHRTTLRRWQMKTASAILAESRVWMEENEYSMLCNPDEQGYSFFMMMSDGTNSLCSQGISFDTAYLNCLYLIGGVEDRHRAWPEAVPVEADCKNTDGTWACIQQQLAQVGCPAFECGDKVGSRPNKLRAVLNCSDGGPDQIGARRRMRQLISPRPHVFFADLTCLAHHQSIVERHCLKTADVVSEIWSLPHRYYSAMVKLVNCWRANARKFRPVLTELLRGVDPAGNAVAFAFRKLPQRPIATRWGYSSEAEDFFLNLLAAEFETACGAATVRVKPADLVSMIERSTDLWKKHVSKLAAGPIDEMALDESKAYQAKHGRWNKETIESVKECNFCVMMKLAHAVRSPWRHFHLCLQASDTDFGTPQSVKPVPVWMDMVTGKAMKIDMEFDSLLDRDWTSLRDCGGLEEVPLEIIPTW